MTVSLEIAAVGEPLPSPPEPDGVPDVLQPFIRCDRGQWFVDCPGLLSSGGRLILVLPRIYAGTSVADRQHVPVVFVSALARLLREARRSVSTVQLGLDQALISSSNGGRLLDRLEAALLLLRDYAQHGPITVLQCHSSSRERGAIHWPRSLARSLAIVSGPNVVVADPIQTRVRINQHHPLVVLHESVCAEVFALFGYPGNLFDSERLPPRRAIFPLEAIALLDRLDRDMFRDRQRVVVGLLRRYLGKSGLVDGTERHVVSGVLAVNFPMVWERMLTVALGPSRDYEMPAGDYRLSDSGTAGGLRLRPDLVIDGRYLDQDVLLVVDAKDYDPDSTNRWPASDSIGKQLLYRYLLSDLYQPGQLPLGRIGNAFLLPAHLDAIAIGDGKVLVHRHRATHDIRKETGLAPFGRIVCIDVHFERVAQAFTSGRADIALRSAVIDAVMREMHAVGNV